MRDTTAPPLPCYQKRRKGDQCCDTNNQAPAHYCGCDCGCCKYPRDWR